MSFFDDDLSPEDMKFLQDWENMGKSETADSEYQPEGEFEGGQGDATELLGGELDSEGEHGGEKAGELDEESDNGGIESESADSISIDGTSEQQDHLESGESDSEIQDGESELEFDDLSEDVEGSEPEDDPFFDVPYEDDPDYGEGIQEENPEVPEDSDYEDAQIEEDDGVGERGNSDEARESDEPIDTESEIPEHDSEADEIDENIEATDLEENPEAKLTPKADAEHEAPEDFDAQAELDAHLNENQDAEPEQKADKADEIPEGAKAPQEGQENAFEGVPAPGEACTNHCEDNENFEDHDGECPHCKSRITKERELWGVIGTDMNGNDIYPGDKLLVSIPITFATVDTLLTANVPNQAVDPIRVAEATDDHVDTTICWLSGRISQFTGWHMQEAGNSIWTFPVGKRIGFVQKVGEIAGHDSHGSNADEGDQLDIDDMLRDIEQKGQDKSEKEAEESYDDDENEPEDKTDSEGDNPDSDEAEGEADGDGDENRKHQNRRVPKHQRARFLNLEHRITKKIEQTFGSTLDSIEVKEVSDEGDDYVHGVVKVISRGMTFFFDFNMRRYDEEQDGPIGQDEQKDEAA
jgi:hypothetical protein